MGADKNEDEIAFGRSPREDHCDVGRIFLVLSVDIMSNAPGDAKFYYGRSRNPVIGIHQRRARDDFDRSIRSVEVFFET